MYFLALWLTRDRHFDLKGRTFALGAIAVAALITASAGAPIWVFGIIALVALLWRVPLDTSPHHRGA